MEQDRILFERTLSGSYMKIKAGNRSEFDEQMLQRQKLSGLLSVEKCYVDGGVWYWYDISGKQSLDSFCRIKPLGEAFLRQILCSVCAQLEILEQHLIYTSCLQLEPELIYIVNNTQEIVFTAFPGSEGEVSQGFCSLMEYLLTRIDHKEAQAVRLAYEIYERTLQEGYRIRDIRDAIFAVSEPQDHSTYMKESEPQAMPLDCHAANSEGAGVIQRETVIETKRQSNPGDEIGKQRKKAANTSKCKLIFSRMLGIWDEWKQKLQADQPKEKACHIIRPEDYVEETVPISMHAQIHPTICLTDYRNHPEGLLLYEGYEHFDNIRLGERTVQVGQSEESDIKIARDTISRMHARIEYRDEEYYLEDLNSTNGTFVNDEPLSYKQEQQLKTNDIVRFADVKYRFV